MWNKSTRHDIQDMFASLVQVEGDYEAQGLSFLNATHLAGMFSERELLSPEERDARQKASKEAWKRRNPRPSTGRPPGRPSGWRKGEDTPQRAKWRAAKAKRGGHVA